MIAILGLLGLGFLGAALVGGQEQSSEVDSDVDIETSDNYDVELVETGNFIAESELSPVETAESADQDPGHDIQLVFDTPDLIPDQLVDRTLIYGGPEDDVLDGRSGVREATGEHLFGGGGNDTMIGGNGDVLIGGFGEDQYEVYQQDQLHILGFETDEILVIHHDGEPPEISGALTDEGVSILANGIPIVFLDGIYDFDFDNIRLQLEQP